MQLHNPLLDLYPRGLKTHIQKKNCMWISITLLRIAKKSINNPNVPYRWAGKQNVIYPYNGILSSCNKERSLAGKCVSELCVTVTSAWKHQCIGGKGYFGSWFQGSQSMVSWFCCWDLSRHIRWSVCPWWTGSRERERKGRDNTVPTRTHSGPTLFSKVSPKFPSPPDSPSNYEPIHGLIHWWCHSPHDPAMS
jgi:hypothetical protein